MDMFSVILRNVWHNASFSEYQQRKLKKLKKKKIKKKAKNKHVKIEVRFK